MFKPLITVLTAAAMVLAGQAAGAEEVHNRTTYAIALAGLPLANANFQTRRTGREYAVDAQIASTGIGEIIANTKAEMSSAGEVGNDGFRPTKFTFRYSYGKKTRTFETHFRGGDVVASVIYPPHKKRKDWIPVQPEDLRSVTDPVAGLIVPGEIEPCRAEIPVYDGEARLDLRLSRKGEETFKTEGFEGQAIVCSIRYEPKSGYRKNHGDINYVRKLKTMEIWFAKSPTINVYAPVFLSVPTKYGTLTITATHFDG